MFRVACSFRVLLTNAGEMENKNDDKMMELDSAEFDLLWRYVTGSATHHEKEKVQKAIEGNPSYRHAFEQLALIFHAGRTRERIIRRDSKKALGIVHRKIRWRSQMKKIRKAAVAASLFIGLAGISMTVYQNFRKTAYSETITIETNAGMRSSVKLPDGTMVYLNAESTLEYPVAFDKKKRKVRLDGEAYFNVVHNEKQPFTVNTPGDHVTIEVLGTDFNLQAYSRDSSVQATLVRGKIIYNIPADSISYMLRPSDMVTYDIAKRKVSHAIVDTDRMISWIDGRFVFKDTPITDMIRQLSHYYSVDFSIEDKRLENYVFTGKFQDAPLEQILDYLKLSSDIGSETTENDGRDQVKLYVRDN